MPVLPYLVVAFSSTATQKSDFIVFRSCEEKSLVTGPVHDGDEINEASAHRYLGHVGTPNMNGPVDGHMPQQIEVDPVMRVRLAGLRWLIDRQQAHLVPQTPTLVMSDA